MTHEELLARIAKLSITPETNVVPSELAASLLAVVELHGASPEGRYDKPICIGCSFTETGHYVFYPCRNIQAIEKELE